MGTEKNNFIKFCCFGVLLLAAALIFVDSLLSIIGVEPAPGEFVDILLNVMRTIKDLALLLGIVFGAWAFVENRTRTWKIIFVIALIIYIAAVIMVWF